MTNVFICCVWVCVRIIICVCVFTGPSERYYGTAKVRYDFSARDRNELSLREGDTVKIISKKAHNGWWKGEVYGRV